MCIKFDDCHLLLPGGFVVVMIFLLKEKVVIFLIVEIFSQKGHKSRNMGIDFFTGNSGRQGFSKLGLTA